MKYKVQCFNTKTKKNERKYIIQAEDVVDLFIGLNSLASSFLNKEDIMHYIYNYSTESSKAVYVVATNSNTFIFHAELVSS